MNDTPHNAQLWVFGYGSLIWDPGFAVAERRIAALDGWHRSFCMRSIHHRGSVASPGLVLALDRRARARCEGIALAIARGQEDATLAALRERELISAAYLEEALPVTFRVGGTVTALVFVIDPTHGQYCGGIAPEDQAQIIARAEGGRGTNRDYLFSTATHLARLGIEDPDLTWLATRVGQIVAASGR